MRIHPDDDIHRVRSVYHGPVGSTFPWSASYPAYTVFFIAFTVICLFKWVTPLTLETPPIFEVMYAVITTYAVMHLSNFEKPVQSLPRVVVAEVTAPRAPKETKLQGVTTAKIRLGA